MASPGVLAAAAPDAWILHFGDAPFDTHDRKFILIRQLCEFFVHRASWEVLSGLSLSSTGRVICRLDYSRLCEVSRITELEWALQNHAWECLGCIGAALYEVLFEERQLLEGASQRRTGERWVHREAVAALLGCQPAPAKPIISPYNAPFIWKHMHDIQGSTVGCLVGITGCVVRRSPVQPAPCQVTYICSKCGRATCMECTNGRPTAPVSCTDGCKSKAFTACTGKLETVDWQKVQLKELLADGRDGQPGAAPRTLDVELLDHLARARCSCGDTVTVVGFVRAIHRDGVVRDGKGVMLTFLEALSIVNHSDDSLQGLQAAGCKAGTSMTVRDLHFIVSYVRQKAPFQLLHLAHSLCPSILGHHMIKLGLLLALLGGCGPSRLSSTQHGAPAADSGSGGVRENVHVLLVGDPGLGKSALLRAVAAAAPKGVYVCSSTSTGAGLTVSVTKDAVSNDMAFEAGALVLADEGVCCLDELDNLKSEQKMLLDVMEKQEVLVAKAGMTAQLPARTSVVAAANPIAGTYNRARTLKENVNMSSPLLSRFDLIFTLLDEADEDADQTVMEHILVVHSAGSKRARICADSTQASLMDGCSQAATLRQRMGAYVCDDALPAALIRSYVAYARAFCDPVLEHDAKVVLKDFYLELRQQAASIGSYHITARQLDSMVRLSRACARAELRSQVTKQDADDVVELVKFSMRDMYREGAPGMGMGVGGGSTRRRRRGSKAAGLESFIQALQQSKARGRRRFREDELRALAADMCIVNPPVEQLIATLNDRGELLKRGPQLYDVC